MRSALLMVFLPLCAVGCSEPRQLSCLSDQICVSARSDGDSVLLYVHNNTKQFVYVPEITDLLGPGIEFSLSPVVDGDDGGIIESRARPPIYEGQFVGLRPMATYGVILKNEDVKRIFQLESGCQKVLVQAVVLASPKKEIVGANIAGYNTIKQTIAELCL